MKTRVVLFAAFVLIAGHRVRANAAAPAASAGCPGARPLPRLRPLPLRRRPCRRLRRRPLRQADRGARASRST